MPNGFNNDVMFSLNADFSSANNTNPLEANGLFINGQIWIGSTAVNAGGTHVNVATLTAGPGVTITNGPGSITIGATTPTETGLAIYGDGSDGSVTFDGSTTVLGIAPIANFYTLNRDIFLASATLNNGITIFTNGFRIFCRGTFTNNGIIQWDGTNSTVFTGGAARNNGAGTTGSSASTAGGNGATGVGSNGGNATTSIGGVGGAGGAATSAGGAGGTVTAPTSIVSYRALPYAMMYSMVAGSGTVIAIKGGSGGGGGGGDGVNAGGGGGGGGGVIILVIKTFAGTGNIHANGGNGANSGGGLGNVGGGGGGGGGYISIISRSISAGAISGQTITVNGGNPGTGIGTGLPGIVGNVGRIILLGD